jgi:hypothetical protein
MPLSVTSQDHFRRDRARASIIPFISSDSDTATAVMRGRLSRAQLKLRALTV